MAGGTRTIYEFGGFRLDGGRRLLILMTRDGETVKLTSKGFETLLCLIEHRSKTLEKEQLLRTVWPDTVVDEHNLNRRISELRRAFGEKQGEDRYVATVLDVGSSSLLTCERWPDTRTTSARTPLPLASRPPSSDSPCCHSTT